MDNLVVLETERALLATGAAILATAALLTFRIYLFTDGSVAQREPVQQPPIPDAKVSLETMGA